jgi:tRNA/rRNA methyltransferase
VIDQERNLNLSRVAVVLVRPQYAGNLGQCARAMRNFSLRRLVLVDPQCDPGAEEARWYARAEGEGILESARTAVTLAEALAGFQVVVGTSRRLGRYRRPAITPEEVARELIPLSRDNEIALVFGNESSGLTWEDLDLCHRLVTFPADPEFPSFNLAHAVLLMGWELFRATAPPPPDEPVVRAPHAEVEAFFRHAHETWLRIGYLKRQNPWPTLTRWRRILGRAGLSAHEVAVMRGLLHQVDWLADRAGLPPPDEEPPPGTFNKHGKS